ncbi:tRNA (adenosine(37)-N6)-threonylcarbamoyltransferase complex ATPase subunit type 1 TsaE [Salibacterium halotolerans]|uniref:tRNA threonylcarbamoyladenosine biosynthesis protein TsaE n=1 Tax=Salibacterium halotolerans TaxID=1884432 RepID=A0A1I5P7K8_9BACI|nr:tRNA (adenosine(37)-N6)-threonylcarbamoyltransferase complex ATPase subunit type 1 TsaE [Salibacterium halotolerans]SFP30089.1 tRNA threonylcarbamoyladenosine biosynthesis protein TsaE [Salibacterium halotolerans]
MSFSFTSHSPSETMQFGGRLGVVVQSGDVITLDGDLGAGKTHLTKGLADALSVKEIVNSPTFTIIKEYSGLFPLYHMDLYRLDGEEADEIGLEEYLESSGVCVVEWAEKIRDLLPDNRLQITMERRGEEERIIRLLPVGESFTRRCKELENHENTGD